MSENPGRGGGKPLQRIFSRAGGQGGGLPRGAGLGAKLLGTAALIGVGIYQSMYTGEATLPWLAGRRSRVTLSLPLCSGGRPSSYNLQQNQWCTEDDIQGGTSLKVERASESFRSLRSHCTDP